MSMQDLVGQRIKTIRRQRGLSQAQLAHPELSDSYVSLIESGKRTPTPAVLELLAQKLDCSLTYLVNGVTAEQMEELELGLRFARLALDNGDVAEARRRYAELLADSSLAGLTALRLEARFGYALAVEACGDLREAIATLDELNQSEPSSLTPDRRIAVALALCRCYREKGDFAAAVEVGERALGTMVKGTWTDELIELGATLLAAYMVRGDMLRSTHFAAELVAAAEGLGTPRATVASCWNAAVVAQMTGRGGESMALLDRALAIQSETGDPRNLARLRQAYAAMMLRVQPGSAEEARAILLRAQREHGDTATSEVDRVRCGLTLALAELILGNPRATVEVVEGVRTYLTEATQGSGLSSYLLLAQAYCLLHRDEESAQELAVAAEYLKGLPRTRKTAEEWMTVGQVHGGLGDHGASASAYREALVCAGL